MNIPRKFYCVNIKLKEDTQWHHFCDEESDDLSRIVVSNLKVNPEVVAIRVHKCAVKEETTIEDWVRNE